MLYARRAGTLYEKSWAAGVEHYIIEGVTDALFLDFRNYHNRKTVKNIAGVTATGCVYQTP